MDTKCEKKDTEMLAHTLDRYQGAIFDGGLLPELPEIFDKMLQHTLKVFREEGKIRGLWLKIPVPKSNLIPIAAKHGFVFHHTKTDYLMMTHWLSEEANHLPHFASHYVGVGGMVINVEKESILVIQEKVAFRENLWKIPGGLVDNNEFIPQAAEREVFEETGIKTKFLGILAIREKKKYKFGQQDIYFIALLQPLSYEIKIDPGEIRCAEWMAIEEFANKPDFIETQRKIAHLAFNYLKNLKNVKKEFNKEELLALLAMEPVPFEMEIGIDGGGAPENIFYSSKLYKA